MQHAAAHGPQPITAAVSLINAIATRYVIARQNNKLYRHARLFQSPPTARLLNPPEIWTPAQQPGFYATRTPEAMLILQLLVLNLPQVQFFDLIKGS